MKHRHIATCLAILALGIGGCVTATGPITPQQVAELRALEVDTAARLSAEGAALYQSDSDKKGGYEYCSIATRLAYEGEFRRAIREATKALFLGENGGDTNLLAQANRDIALAYSLSGQLDRAVVFIERSVKAAGLSTRMNGRTYASIYKIRGDIRLRQGHADQAIADYKVALGSLAGASDGRSADLQRLTRLSLANAHLATRNLDAAGAIFAELRPLVGSTYIPLVDRGLANLALLQGRLDEATRLFTSAATAYERDGNAYHLLWALDGLARSRAAAHDAAGAVAAYARAIKAAEVVRAEFRSEEFKTGFFGDLQTIFERAITLSMEQGRISEALDFSEQSRARALLDMVRGRVAAGSGQAFSDAYGRPHTSVKIQEALPDGLVLVLYHVLPDRTYVWSIRKSGISAAQIPVGRNAVRKLVSDFREWVVTRRQQSSQASADLFRNLIQPLQPRDGEELVVVPHDVLHYLPFHALSGPGGYLIEGHPVSYATSASDAVYRLARKRDAIRQVVAFGNPDLGVPSLNLPGAEGEARTLGSIYPGTQLFLKAAATKGRFISEAPGKNLLHIAAHAEVDKVDPLYSVIHLARTKEGPGDLEAHQIYGVDLQSAHLVALSACETGLGQVSSGDEIWGFTRTFLSAGARSLLVSLWPVADESTEHLMTRFYREISGGRPMARAIRQAQLELLRRKETSHPFFWAPFVLVGDWS